MEELGQVGRAGTTGEEDGNRRIVMSAGLMSVMTTMSRILGLVRDMSMAAFMGTSMHMDAFRVGNLLPNMLRRLLGEGAMTAAFIPIFAEVDRQGDRRRTWRFVGTFFCTFSVVLLIVAACGMAASPLLVDLITQDDGFGAVPGKVALTVELTRLMFPYIALISMTAVVMAVLNSFGSFGPSAFTPVLLNISIIVCGWALASTFTSPAFGFAIGVLLGGLAQFLFQIPFLRRFGFEFHFGISFTDPAVRRVFKLMIPGIFAVGITQINIGIATWVLSGLGQGAISGIYYSDRLMELALGIFAISVSTVILPAFSRQAAAGDKAALRSTLSFAVRLVAFITIPAAVGLITLRKPIVSAIFERGEFDARSIELTANPLFFFSLGLFLFALIKVLAPAFYALKEIHIPVMISAADMTLNVVLCVVLSSLMGNSGVALALTCGATLNVCLLLIVFARRHGALPFAQILGSLARTVTAALVMGLFAWAGMAALGLEGMANGWTKLLLTLGLILASIAVYAVMTLLLRVRVSSELVSMFRGKKP